MIRQVLMRRIASDRLAARLGQALSSVGACLIPVLVCRRFAEIELSEAQLLIGVVATMSMALLLALIATVLGERVEPKSTGA